MTTGPEQPHGQEFAPLESSPPADPYAPVDYPAGPGLPPPVYDTAYGVAYPPPPEYPAPPAYPPPPAYPAPPGYGSPPPYPPQAGGYGYGAYDPYRPATPAGTNGKAIAALVTSLVGLVFCGVPSVVGLILGVIAMRETRSTGQEGYGIALAGAIVGALVVVGWVLYFVLIIGLITSGVSVV